MSLVSAESCAAEIEKGKVIAYPTETVWGLGASIYNNEAIKKVFEIKGRSFQQPLSVLVRDVEAAKALVMLNQKEKLLLKCFWPGPVSFIFPALDKDLASSLGSTDGTICLRCSDHDWIKQFVLLCDSPIVSTSANKSGAPAATRQDELSWLPEDVTIVDWKVSNKGDLPSTILKTKGDTISVIREGAWSVKALEPLFDKLNYQII